MGRIIKYLLVMAGFYSLGIYIMSRMEWGEVCTVLSVVILLVIFVLSWLNEKAVRIAKEKLPIERNSLALLTVVALSILYTFGAIALLPNTGKIYIPAIVMLYGIYDAYSNLKFIFE